MVYSYANRLLEDPPDMFCEPEDEIFPGLLAVIGIMKPGDTLIVSTKYDLISDYCSDKRLSKAVALIKEKHACLKVAGEIFDFRN